MKYDRILIDVSNIYYRAYITSQHLTATVDGEQMVTGGIYTVLKMLKRLKNKYMYDDGRMYFLFDNASSGDNKRKEIDPDYKANRTKMEPAYYRGLDYLYLVLQNYSDDDRLIRRPGNEADDLVKPVLKSFEGKDYRVLLVSNDFDWARSISKKVHWLTKKNSEDVLVQAKDFVEKYGFNPTEESICLYKAIRGDSSDNIPIGLPRIQEKVLVKIIDQVGSVKNLYKQLGSLDISDKWKQEFILNRGRIQLNEQLVVYDDLTIRDCLAYTEITKFCKPALGMLYRSLKFVPETVDPCFKEEPKELEIDDFFGAEQVPRA